MNEYEFLFVVVIVLVLFYCCDVLFGCVNFVGVKVFGVVDVCC